MQNSLRDEQVARPSAPANGSLLDLGDTLFQLVRQLPDSFIAGLQAKAWKQFSTEVQKGFDSAERDGRLTMDEVEAMLWLGDE